MKVPRIETHGVMTGVNTWYYDSSWKTGVYAPFASSRSSTLCGTVQKTYISDPTWRDKVIRGLDASHPYTRKGYAYVIPARISGQSWTMSGSSRIHSLGFGVYVDPSQVVGDYTVQSDSALRDLALLRLKRKLNSHLNRQNLLVPVVELREMRGLIRTLAEQSLTFLYKWGGIVKTKGKSAKRVADDAWLTWSFGIKPTLNDVQEASQNIANHLLREDHLVHLTGAAGKDWLTSRQSTGNTGLFGAPVTLDGWEHRKLSYRYVAGFNLKLKSANDYSAVRLFSFVPEALPSVGWERLPYSWMFDYFTNVSAYLDDTFVLPPGSTQFLILDTRYTVSGDSTPSFAPTTGTSVLLEGRRRGEFRWVYFDRQVLASLPRIGLHFKNVDQIGQNAVNRILNLCALVKYR